MKKSKTLGSALSLLTAVALLLSLCVIPAAAADAEETDAPAAVFENTSGDGGENYISLCDARTFQAMLPVDMTEEEAQAAAETVVWSLDYIAELEYVDPQQYPNHTQGGALDSWTLREGTGNLFTDVQTGAETVDGQVYLTVTFANDYYYDLFADLPNNLRGYQTNGGTYLDLCGWYNLTATAADGTVLGAVGNVKITPYDDFHTMKELYESMDELVAYAQENTDLYVVKESMGISQGDNGLESLDMPYLIIAKDQAAVEKWQEIKAEAESDPTGLIEKLENGTLGDYQVPVLYSNIHSNEVAAPDGVLKFAWMLVGAAASESGTIAYDNLTGFTAEGEAKLAEQMGPAGEEGSIAVPELVADDATYLGFIKATEESGTVSPWTTSAKLDLEQAASELNRTLQEEIGGCAYISVNKALVTQASAAIPVVPLYISLLYKVMKQRGLHEGCIEQAERLFGRLYGTESAGNPLGAPTDSSRRIRLDDLEMKKEVQEDVNELWDKVTSENIGELADIAGYREAFLQIFGFAIPGIDYDADTEIL